MKRKIQSVFALLATALMTTQFSCSATLSTSLRDAAIKGAAGFVQSTTTELLDRWFTATLPE